MIMIQEPNDPKQALELYTAMRHFGEATETRNMVEWLKSELAREMKANICEPNEVTLRQCQGICQALDKILSMVDGAREKVNDIDAARKEEARLYDVPPKKIPGLNYW